MNELGKHLRPRAAITFSLVLVLLSVVILTGALSNLKLSPGQPFPGGVGNRPLAEQTGRTQPFSTNVTPVLQGLFAIIFIVLLIYLPIKLLLTIRWKTLLLLVLVMAAAIAVLALLPAISYDQAANFPQQFDEYGAPPSFDFPTSPLGQPPPALQYVVIGVVGFGILSVIAMAIRQGKERPTAKDQMLKTAERAVASIQKGMAWENVIIRCYAEMSQLLFEERDLKRGQAMTVREFQYLLSSRGVPVGPVKELTALFEQARYGDGVIRELEERRALDCLNEIIKHYRYEAV